MIAIEGVRVGGLIAASILAAYGVFSYRRGGWRRLDLLLALGVAFGVGLVSVLPRAVGEVFVRLLGLENRAFALLSFAVLTLFGLLLYVLGQVREASRRNGRIVSGIAVRGYAERHLEPGEPLPEDGGILVVVPAYNEAGGIRGVLRRVPDELFGRPVKTVVVDDGSSDGTGAIARGEGVPVATHVVNRGQGDALRTGFEIAKLERAGVVINLDADGQYRPEELERLVGPIVEGEADFVLGSRFHGFYEEAGSLRHAGVVFFSKVISVLSGVPISDCTNGYRAIRGTELPKLDLREDRFNATEIILEALRNGLRFEEVPISMLRRAAGETKKPPRLRYPLGVFRVIVQTWLR